MWVILYYVLFDYRISQKMQRFQIIYLGSLASLPIINLVLRLYGRRGRLKHWLN